MNVKRMEVMIEDLSENFDRHVATSTQDYYFALTGVNGESDLSLRVYSQGCEAQLEVLAFCQGGQPSRRISVDGKAVDEREGAITIAPITLERGWRVLDISVSNVATGRVRLTGNVSQASVVEN